MKTIYKLLPATAVLAFMGSCNDLDTEPMGGVITSDQKEEVVANNPSMSSAGVISLPQMMKQYCGILGNSNYQNDFGWPASMLFMDSRTADMSSTTDGYNWFRVALDYSDKTDTSQPTRYFWGTNYNMIYTCNNVLVGKDYDTEDDDLKYNIAQALGFRAWAYFNLAQMYQFTYVGNEDKPCVPILTETNMEKAVMEGMPRASVREVYEQIHKDLDKALELLEDVGEIIPGDIANTPGTRDAKQLMGAVTIAGIRARVNLVENNWDDAAADAQYVIQNSKATPYSIAAVSKPSFWDASASSWIFAIDIESGEVGNMHCWPAHAVSFYKGGYAQVGVFRKINKALYDYIPSTDVRKGWWCNENGLSANLDANHSNILYGLFDSPTDAAYVNVKFDTYNSLFTGMCYLNDLPLMRIEEMYYILAEALAMGGDPTQAMTVLSGFVKTYRDPGYTFTSSSAEDIQNEIWNQRRIEFWGEGLAYYDIQRLKKPMDRVGGGFEASVVFNIPANDPLRIYRIPQSEMQTNKGITENNPLGGDPTPIVE